MAGWEKEDMDMAFAHEEKRAGEARVVNLLAVEARGGKTPRAKAAGLAPTTAQLADHPEAYVSGTAKVAYLKGQHTAYMARAPASC